MKRAGHLPVHKKTEVPRQVDLAAKLPQRAGDGLDLVEVAGGIERLPVKQHGRRLVAGLGQALRLAKQPGDGLAAEIHAGVAQQTGDELLGGLGVNAPDQLESQRTRLGVVTPVQQEFTQLDQRQFPTLGQRVAGDHLDGTAKIVRCERVRPVHPGEQRRQRAGTALGQSLQRPAGGSVALPLATDGAQRRHRLV